MGMTEDFGQHGTNAPANDAAPPWEGRDEEGTEEAEESETENEREEREEREERRRPERG